MRKIFQPGLQFPKKNLKIQLGRDFIAKNT